MDGLDHLGAPGAQGGMGRIGAHQGVVLPAALALVSIGLAHQYPHTGDGGVAPLGVQSRVVRHLHVGDDEQVGPLVLELLLKGGQVVRLVLGCLLYTSILLEAGQVDIHLVVVPSLLHVGRHQILGVLAV